MASAPTRTPGCEHAQAAVKFRSPTAEPASSQSSGFAPEPPGEQRLQSAPAPERDPGRPQRVQRQDRRGRRERLRQRRLAALPHHQRRPVLDHAGPFGGDRGDGRLLRRRRRSGADLQPARPRVLLRAALLLPRLPAVRGRGDPSTDNGRTWTGSAHRRLSGHATSADSSATSTRRSFYDKEQITVDNNPSSPHYGRIYVTYIKFHMQPNGFSDYCPVQVAYTDNIDPNGDGDLTDAVWHHTGVVPDNPGGNGKGPSANQGAQPVVDNQGGAGHLLHDRGVQHVARPRDLHAGARPTAARASAPAQQDQQAGPVGGQPRSGRPAAAEERPHRGLDVRAAGLQPGRQLAELHRPEQHQPREERRRHLVREVQGLRPARGRT